MAHHCQLKHVTLCSTHTVPLTRECSTHTVPLYTVQYTHSASLHCAVYTQYNTDYVHINGLDRTINVILTKHCIELPDDGSLVIRNMLEQF